MVGACAPLGQGRRRVLSAAGALLLVLAAPAAADRRDQKAADLYVEGVKLIRQGRYREGAAKVNAALARGATEPVEAQGSETRFLARPYDPYYWLGVAQMETGLLEQALVNFEKSATMVPKGRSRPVLADAPAEWADLERRRAALQARLEPPTPVPTAVVAAVIPPTPTPLALKLAERAAPTPVPTVAVAALPTAAPAPSPLPELPATALGLRDDLAALLAEPSVAFRAEEPLREALARLDRGLRDGPGPAAAAERELRRGLASAEAAIPRAALVAGLEALRDRRHGDAARLARLAARLVPAAPQPRVLLCAAVGSEWVLGGETRADLALEAREAYAAWVARRRDGAPPSGFLSPALRERLAAPVPVPSRG